MLLLLTTKAYFAVLGSYFWLIDIRDKNRKNIEAALICVISSNYSTVLLFYCVNKSKWTNLHLKADNTILKPMWEQY